MSTQTQIVQGNNGARSKALDTYVASLATSKMHLLAAPFKPTPTTPLADLVANETHASGYTAKLIGPWRGGFWDQAGQRYWVSVMAQFDSTDAITPNDISGGWFDDGNATTPAVQGVFTFTPQLQIGGPNNPTIMVLIELRSVIGGQVEVGP